MDFKGILLFAVFIVCHFSFGGAQIERWNSPDDISSNSGESSKSIEVAEDASNGKTVYTFEAAPTGSDTISKYELVDLTNEPFSISSPGGVLTVSGNLNYEGTEKYTIKVKASDSNDPPNTATATVTVTVTDINEKPEFEKTTYDVCAKSGSSAGDTIATLSATDPDAGNTITYSIHSGDTDTDFKISESKLEVNTGKKLDMDSKEKYTLVIYAEDDATQKKTGSATYEIEVSTCNGGTALTLTFLTLLLALVVSMS